MNEGTEGTVSRRDFLPGAGAALAAFTILPRHVLGGQGAAAPSDKLNIAAVGVGGMGQNYMAGCKGENMVAIADVDSGFAAPVFKKYPAAKIYKDYRVLMEKEKGIDAVIIGTPDHSHACIAMAAIGLKKHVYVAKPMTRTIHEARTVTKAAREARVATQMSVQSCSNDAAVTTEEWIKAGVVGAIREVHVWTDRPVWPQALDRPKGAPKVPKTLDWDAWLGPAPVRPYHPVYHPFNFRGWYDFGTGALGDMACHSFHVIVKALSLGAPVAVSSSTTAIRQALQGDQKPDPDWARSRVATNPETFPASSITTWDFPARDGQPPVRMHWYEGGLKPPRPVEMQAGRSLGVDGVLWMGEKGALLTGFSGGVRFLNEAQKQSITPPPKTLPRTADHYLEWVEACKGGKPASCNFEFASLVAEIALLGVAAQRTGKYLAWDAANARFTNGENANQFINPPYRAGWSL